MVSGSFYQVMMAIGLGSVLAASLAPLPLESKDDGRYSQSPLKPWFDGLASDKGLCCSFADGFKVDDVDWDTGGPGGKFRVFICTTLPEMAQAEDFVKCKKDWLVVPDSAVVKVPNRFGPAVVWPYLESGAVAIRCFLPGAGT